MPASRPDLPDSAARAYDEAAAELLRRPGVSLGRILSSEALTVHGSVFAFIARSGALVVKAPPDTVRARLDAGTSQQMAVGGRRMREWLVTGPDRLDEWAQLMDVALAYVGSLPPSSRRR